MYRALDGIPVVSELPVAWALAPVLPAGPTSVPTVDGELFGRASLPHVSHGDPYGSNLARSCGKVRRHMNAAAAGEDPERGESTPP